MYVQYSHTVRFLDGRASILVIYIFRHHKHGAVDIYNSQNVIVKNCTFSNNTSDNFYFQLMKEYQGSAGGLSVGYNMNHSTVTLNMTIIDTKFISNSALPLAKYRRTSSEMIYNRNFTGRGGGLSVLVNARFSQLVCVIKNCSFVNNSAERFGGALYVLVTHVFNDQIYQLDSNNFSDNTAPIGGGLLFVDLREEGSDDIYVNITVFNCTFTNNTVKDSAGAVGIYSSVGKTRYSVVFKDCVFYHNIAVLHGGAIHLGAYRFHKSGQKLCHVHIVNWLVYSYVPIL